MFVPFIVLDCHLSTVSWPHQARTEDNVTGDVCHLMTEVVDIHHNAPKDEGIRKDREKVNNVGFSIVRNQPIEHVHNSIHVKTDNGK